MAGDVDYMLRVVVTDIAGYDTFYKGLIAAVPLKNVTSRFAMEKIKSTTALPIPEAQIPRGFDLPRQPPSVRPRDWQARHRRS